MTPIGRRHFCAAVGAGIVGFAGVLAGCSNGAGDTKSTPPASARSGGALADLTFAVRRDPG